MSLRELKAQAAALGITEPEGHKGHKSTWIDAIKRHQRSATLSEGHDLSTQRELEKQLRYAATGNRVDKIKHLVRDKGVPVDCRDGVSMN